MNNIAIRKIDIVELDTDCIVNAANQRLAAGGGVCGAIFREAGIDQLTAACRKIGHCPTGNAVITPGFKLKARFIIHAVGPVWNGGNAGEAQDLYDCYQNSLELAVKHDLHSIGFPLISSGIYGYPIDQAWSIAIQSCSDYLRANPDADLEVTFAVRSDDMLEMGKDEIDRQDLDFLRHFRKPETR